MEIKIELLKLKKRQVDLIAELQKLGHKVTPADLSSYLSGALKTPKAEAVIEDSERIIEKWKTEGKL